MKKIFSILVSVVFMIPLLFVSTTALATGVCPEGFSGPDSENMCKSNKYTCHVENNNTAVIDNDNTQVAVSGDAEGAGARTGSASNNNKVTFSVSIGNKNGCIVSAVTPAKNQGQGAAGGGGVSFGSGVVAPSNVVASTLPNTSSDVVSSYLTFIAESLGISVVAACIAAVLYRRFQM